MSGRGVEFLEAWVNKYVSDAEHHGTRERANEFADFCVAEAATQGNLY